MALTISYAAELATLRDGFGLSERELAGALATTQRTLRRWLSEEAAPRPDARERIEDLLDLLRDLRRSIAADAVPKWVRRRVDLLDGERPAKLLERGELEPLFDVAEALNSGAFV
jgi:transcriptional regulator with XRE-family HTH domain